MPFCGDRNFTVDMFRDVGNDVLLDTLFFALTIRGGTISGDVFPSVGPKLSAVTGTCTSFPKPDISVFTLTFNWGAVNVTVIAQIFEHKGSGRIIFRGRFVATSRVDAAVPEVPEVNLEPTGRRVPIPPSDGDTGTSTGQST